MRWTTEPSSSSEILFFFFVCQPYVCWAEASCRRTKHAVARKQFYSTSASFPVGTHRFHIPLMPWLIYLCSTSIRRYSESVTAKIWEGCESKKHRAKGSAIKPGLLRRVVT
jgi:hypothetical protein